MPCSVHLSAEGRREQLRLCTFTLVAIALMFVLPLAITQMSSQTAMASTPPVAIFTYDPQIPTPGEAVVFNASASYASSGVIAQFAWDFGDGNTSICATPMATHSYPADGNYTVQLTVTDNKGLNNSAVEIVPVMCVEFFRVVYMGTLTPAPNVQVTAYYYNGKTWIAAPAGNNGVEIKYDNTTQPKLAKTSAQRFRNPGYTASILLDSASNIGWDIHHGDWKVYFKFSLFGSIIATWPNTTTQVFSYKKGFVESHNYLPGHQAYWDSSAGTYVICASDIAGHGVSPTEDHPIIVGLSCPPPQKKYYLNVQTSPTGITTIPGTGLYLSGMNTTLTAPTYINVSSSIRYRFSYWDVDGTSRGSAVNSITVQMTGNRTATAHYVTQYTVSFTQTGISSDVTGAIVTVNSNAVTFSNMPYSVWVDSGSSVTYSYGTQVSSTIAGRRYRLNTVTGPASPIAVTSAIVVAGNFVTQYSVTFMLSGLDSTATGTVVTVNGSPQTFASLPYMLWIDNGNSMTYSYNAHVSSSMVGKQFRLATITGPTSPIIVTSAGTVIGNYVSQYLITFSQTGLDSTAAGTVVTVNGQAKLFTDIPYLLWVDSGSSVTYTYNSIVWSSAPLKRFSLLSVSGLSSPITVIASASVNAAYKTQYQLTLDQTGVASDFTGTVLTIDASGYSLTTLPAQPWLDQGSIHSFSFMSPLVVNGHKQYVWSSTSGLSSLQSGSIIVAGSGNVIGDYDIANQVTFDQIGIGSDFTGTILIVDGNAYTSGMLPVSFVWNTNSTHTFAFQSPLIVTSNTTRYLWSSTSGLSSLQSSSITITGYGNVVGNYKTQFYCSFLSNPPGKANPSGFGWYDSNSYASISTSQYVPGVSRYRFNGWVTQDMSEISNPSSPSTTVLMDKPKTITANYVRQYLVTFTETGLTSDTIRTVINVNGTSKAYSDIPYNTWVDTGGTVIYSYEAIVPSTNLGKQYRLTGVSGLSSPLIVTSDINVTGNYVTQYLLTVTSPYGITSGQGWYDSGTITYASLDTGIVNHGTGTRHVFTNWNADSTGINYAQSNAITMNSSKTVLANWKIQYYVTIVTNPGGVTSPSGAGWYDSNTLATISTSGFVEITPNLSRYRFNGWTTADMSEIAQPTQSPTTVVVDKPKNVTAAYVLQYKMTFNQTGIGPDFTKTVVTVDINDYALPSLSLQFWYDNGSSHSFTFNSPLVVSTNVKQYAWTSTTGSSTLESGTIVVSSSGMITGNYKTQYYLNVLSPYGTPTPGSTWVDLGSSITVSISSPVPGSSGTQYVCTGWTGTGSAPPTGTSTLVTFTINQQTSITWNWKTQYYLSVATSPPGIATISGEGWYDASAHQSLTAPTIVGYKFQNWDIDSVSQGTGVMTIALNMTAPHTATANYVSLLSITVTMTPTSATIATGQTVPFTSTVTGGTPTYTYQWYVNSNPVLGATSSFYYFVPTNPGTYYVNLAVKDSVGNTAESAAAKITVIPIPVGGYSISFLQKPNTTNMTEYFAVTILLGAVMIVIKRKRK